MNNIANAPPPYSMLNPDTSSLSPSAKSRGPRLVSAILVVNHVKKRAGIINIKGVYDVCIICLIENEFKYINALIKIRAMEISYEIVWAIPRNPPNNLHLELDLHPDRRVV